MSQWLGEPETGFTYACQRYLTSMFTGVLSVVAFVSPLAMVVLPKIGKCIYSTASVPFKNGINGLILF